MQFDELNKQVASSTEFLQTSKTEISDLKRTLQALQIELESQLSLVIFFSTTITRAHAQSPFSHILCSIVLMQKAALENQLAETESRYSMHLNQLQGIVNSLEAELSDMKADIERQSSEYQILLDTKTRLELEIAEYRRLLEGELPQ